MQREREVFHREKIEREEGRKQLKAATDEQLRQRAASESALRQELQTSWNQMQQRDQNDSRRASVTAQTRRTFELQERKNDELKDMMSTFSVAVKATFAEIAHAQKGHELGFNMVRAELRDLAGGMSQVVTKTQELESAMEEWTEQEGLETCNEQDQDDSTPRQTSSTLKQAKRIGEYEDVSAPDGAATEETVVLSQPCLFQNEELNRDPDPQSDSQMIKCYICEKYTRYSLKCKVCAWLTCPMCQECFDDLHGDCKQKQNDDGSTPDLDSSSDDNPDKQEQKKVKLLKTLKQRNEQRLKSASSNMPPRR